MLTYIIYDHFADHPALAALFAQIVLILQDELHLLFKELWGKKVLDNDCFLIL